MINKAVALRYLVERNKKEKNNLKEKNDRISFPFIVLENQNDEPVRYLKIFIIRLNNL